MYPQIPVSQNRIADPTAIFVPACKRFAAVLNYALDSHWALSPLGLSPQLESALYPNGSPRYQLLAASIRKETPRM